MQSYDEFFEEHDRKVQMKSRFMNSHFETTEDIHKILNVLIRDIDSIMGILIRIEHKIDGSKEK